MPDFEDVLVPLRERVAMANVTGLGCVDKVGDCVGLRVKKSVTLKFPSGTFGFASFLDFEFIAANFKPSCQPCKY